MQARRYAAAVAVMLSIMATAGAAVADGKAGGYSAVPHERDSESPVGQVSLGPEYEQAWKTSQSRMLTPEELAEFRAWSKANVANNPDYYPEDPEVPAMTPPPLDDDGNEIRGGN